MRRRRDAEVDLTNPDKKILPGMYAYGSITIERPKVWALPTEALDYSGDKTFFWRYDNGLAKRIEVRTGVADGRWIEVTQRRTTDKHGTDPWVKFDGGEQVIVGDLSILSDGLRVQTDKAQK